MFILRAAFWLSIVLLMLPGDPKTGAESPGADALDALIATRAAIADLSGMCERQPDVCNNGGAALASFGSKARSGASFLYDSFHGGSKSTAAASNDAIGATIENASADSAPKGTLTPADAAPNWRGPALPAHGRKV